MKSQQQQEAERKAGSDLINRLRPKAPENRHGQPNRQVKKSVVIDNTGNKWNIEEPMLKEKQGPGFKGSSKQYAVQRNGSIYYQDEFAMDVEDDPTFRNIGLNQFPQAMPLNHDPFNSQWVEDPIDFQDIGGEISSIDDEQDIGDIVNEDLQKIKTGFAGDTFSQISSTFEPP